jgi:L-iditol 2-dehydrogenase
MKACIFHEAGNVKIEEIPTPDVLDGQVLVKTKAASICYSDIRVFRGLKSASPGVAIGHEAAGVVEAVGKNVSSVVPGQLVAVCPIIPCGGCYFCLRGLQNRCEHRETLGYQQNGALAEYILAPEGLVTMGHLLPLDASINPEVAAMVEPFACALYSLETCKLRPGGTVCIIGCGPMGLIHLLIAKQMGASKIIMSDPVEDRLQTARDLGATIAINPQNINLKEIVDELTLGIGADLSIVSVGDITAVEDGIRVTRKQGYINIFGGLPPGSELVVDPNKIHYDELFLTGTQNAPTEHYSRAASLLAVMPGTERLITSRVPLANAPDIFTQRIALQGLKTIVEFP